jgi:hypothetical protein
MKERFYTADTTNGAVANHAALSLSLRCAAADSTKTTCFAPVIWAAGTLFEAEFLYDATVSGGTARSIMSTDGRPVTTDASCQSTPTITGEGVVSKVLFGGASGSGAYCEYPEDSRFLLTAGHTYAVRVTNRSGGNAPISISATFKETTYPGAGF